VAGFRIAHVGTFPGGRTFLRSDGRLFFMRINQDGSASVFAGDPDRPPQEDLGGLDRNVSDKLERAKAIILDHGS
jgi:hypothetical protein